MNNMKPVHGKTAGLRTNLVALLIMLTLIFEGGVSEGYAFVSTGMPAIDQQLKVIDLKIADTQRKINDLSEEKKRALEDLRQGLYCSECRHTKSELQSTGEGFEEHVRRVKGQVLAATSEQIRAKAAEYDRKIAALQKEIDRLRAQGDRLLDQASAERTRLDQAAAEAELQRMRAQREAKQTAHQKAMSSIQKDQDRSLQDIARRQQERESARLATQSPQREDALRREREAEQRRQAAMRDTQRTIDSNRAYTENLDRTFNNLEKGLRDAFGQNPRKLEMERQEMERLEQERRRRNEEAQRLEDEQRKQRQLAQAQLERTEQAKRQAEQDDALHQLAALAAKPAETLADFAAQAGAYAGEFKDIIKGAADNLPLNFSGEVIKQNLTGRDLDLKDAGRSAGVHSLGESVKDRLLKITGQLAPEEKQWETRSWELPLAWTSYNPRKILKTYDDYTNREIVTKFDAAIEWLNEDDQK